MRIVLSILLVSISAFASAATVFGPEMPLTALAPVNAGQEQPVMVYTAKGPVVLWQENGAWIGNALGAQPLTSAQMQLVDPLGYRDAGVVSGGSGTFAAWVENDWVYGVRLDADGKPIGDPTYYYFVDSRHTMRIGVGANSRGYLFVIGLGSRLVAAMVDGSGSGFTPFVTLSNGEWLHAAEKVPIASDGDEFLVVWETTTAEPWTTPCDLTCPNENRRVHSISVAPDGTPRPETETVLATDAAMPDVAWNGSEYVVVWRQMPDGGIGMKTVARGGASAGAGRTLVAGNEIAPRLIADGNSLVLGTIRMPDQTLTVRRLTAGGAVVETIGPVFGGAYPRQYALGARDGQIAVAWVSGGRVMVRRTMVSERPSRTRSVRH